MPHTELLLKSNRWICHFERLKRIAFMEFLLRA